MCLNKVGAPAPPGCSPSPGFPGVGGGRPPGSAPPKGRPRLRSRGVAGTCGVFPLSPAPVQVPPASECSSSPGADWLLVATTQGQPACDLVPFTQVTPENSGPSWGPGPEPRHVPQLGIQPAIWRPSLPGGGGAGSRSERGGLGGPALRPPRLLHPAWLRALGGGGASASAGSARLCFLETGGGRLRWPLVWEGPDR